MAILILLIFPKKTILVEPAQTAPTTAVHIDTGIALLHTIISPFLSLSLSLSPQLAREPFIKARTYLNNSVILHLSLSLFAIPAGGRKNPLPKKESQ